MACLRDLGRVVERLHFGRSRAKLPSPSCLQKDAFYTLNSKSCLCGVCSILHSFTKLENVGKPEQFWTALTVLEK